MSAGILRDGLLISEVPSPYTPTQIVEWLSCIKFPESFSEDQITSGAFPCTLENLGLLVVLHLTTFPFENVTMHYAPEHDMDVTYQGAFKRLVTEHNGSYCFGQNGVFLGMLRGVGYRSYAASARVNATRESTLIPTYTAREHMVIFVQPFKGSNQTYVVDVGFGSAGLVRPILLSDAEDNVVVGTTPTEHHRLTRTAHPLTSIDLTGASSSRSDFDWNLEVRHDKRAAADTRWKVIYSFTESEMFPIDAEDASFVVAHKAQGPFFFNLLCLKYSLLKDLDLSDEQAKTQVAEEIGTLTDEMANEFMFKYIMFGNEVKRSVGGNAVTIRTFITDLERIRALRDIFGLKVPDEAEEHIRGRVAALGSENGSAAPPAKRRRNSSRDSPK